MTHNEAIEILKDNFPYCDQSKKTHEYKECGECNHVCLQKEAFDMAIEALEQCQKAEESFEWCHECKEYDQEKHCCHRFTKKIRNTVSDIGDHYRRLCEKDNKYRWHDLRKNPEDLPKEDGLYLCYETYYSYNADEMVYNYTAYYYFVNIGHFNPQGRNAKVIAWKEIEKFEV